MGSRLARKRRMVKAALQQLENTTPSSDVTPAQVTGTPGLVDTLINFYVYGANSATPSYVDGRSYDITSIEDGKKANKFFAPNPSALGVPLPVGNSLKRNFFAPKISAGTSSIPHYYFSGPASTATLLGDGFDQFTNILTASAVHPYGVVYSPEGPASQYTAQFRDYSTAPLSGSSGDPLEACVLSRVHIPASVVNNMVGTLTSSILVRIHGAVTRGGCTGMADIGYINAHSVRAELPGTILGTALAITGAMGAQPLLDYIDDPGGVSPLGGNWATTANSVLYSSASGDAADHRIYPGATQNNYGTIDILIPTGSMSTNGMDLTYWTPGHTDLPLGVGLVPYNDIVPRAGVMVMFRGAEECADASLNGCS